GIWVQHSSLGFAFGVSASALSGQNAAVTATATEHDLAAVSVELPYAVESLMQKGAESPGTLVVSVATVLPTSSCPVDPPVPAEKSSTISLRSIAAEWHRTLDSVFLRPGI